MTEKQGPPGELVEPEVDLDEAAIKLRSDELKAALNDLRAATVLDQVACIAFDALLADEHERLNALRSILRLTRPGKAP